MECYHAIPCMGAVLHTLNLRLGPADLGYIIQHANDRMIICDFDLLKLLAQVEPSMLQGVELLICVGEDGVANEWELPTGLDSSKTIDYEEFLNSGDPEFEWPKFPETTTMGLCYTSGTTGKPKGAAYSHRSTYLHTLVLAQGDQLCLRGYEVVLPFVPMFHVLSWCLPFAMMMGGVRSVLTSRFMDPATMVQMIIDWKVALSTGVPTVWRGVRNYIEQQGLETMRPRLASFNRLICAGSAPPMELMRWFFQELLGIPHDRGWGMTETNPVGSIAQRVCKYSDLSKTEEETLKNVLMNTDLKAEDADMDDFSREAPRGEAGELMEYFQTEAPNKFHEGWLATGDVAKIDHEGAIVITDRSKDVRQHLSMAFAKFQLPDDVLAPWDAYRGCRRLVGLLGLDWQKEHAVNVNTRMWEVWNALPLTGTGKIDKKAIRAQLPLGEEM
ncbi:Medium-chain-fatty-acid--CoA ligase (Medium-chain acyl-CoA synthetase) [Durusdinium trenchii]|uniref:Medium-chain-fatty-acid--CoA ligase (Medium-chain acyl-CoA synthetase) n=1 Tax=Durusdinium trenchii TaxID=1381693 RepID=A0ABP0QDN7_9DINO